MALSNYSDLQAAIQSFSHRSDSEFTSNIADFIRLAEADMQVRAKLGQWDTTASVSLTSGVGSLPGDFVQAISVTYGAGLYTVPFLPVAQFESVASAGDSGEPKWFTVRGSSLLLYPLVTASVTLSYTARFTPLSNSATTNSLLTLFPDAYLSGSLMHASNWERNQEEMVKQAAIFEQSITRIKAYMRDYKYPHGLQMRAA